MTVQSIEPGNFKGIKFYRRKRIFRSLLCSIPAYLISNEVDVMAFTYILATLFWDWWFFSYRKVKESDTMPEWYLEWKKITPAQVDRYVTAMMYIRRIVFFVAIVWVGFKISIEDIELFWLESVVNYVMITPAIIMLGVAFKILKIPYPTPRWAGSTPHTFGTNSSGSMHTTSWGDDRFTNLSNPLHPSGYNNPSSPTYIGSSFLNH